MTPFQLPESAHAPCTSTMMGLGPLVQEAALGCAARPVAAPAGPVWPVTANSSPAMARTAAAMMSRGLVSRAAKESGMVGFLSAKVL
jgi:hypothetical protein